MKRNVCVSVFVCMHVLSFDFSLKVFRFFGRGIKKSPLSVCIL